MSSRVLCIIVVVVIKNNYILKKIALLLIFANSFFKAPTEVFGINLLLDRMAIAQCKSECILIRHRLTFL